MGLTVYGGGGKPEEEKTVTAGTSVIEVLPSSGKTMKKVNVNPTPTEEKTITAGTSATMVTPTSGKYIKKVTVNPTPSQSKTVTPSTSQQTVSPDSGKLLSQVIVKAMEDVTPEVTAQTPVITQIAENLGITITTPSGTNKQILQGNNANLLNIKNNAKKEGLYVWKKYEIVPPVIVTNPTFSGDVASAKINATMGITGTNFDLSLLGTELNDTVKTFFEGFSVSGSYPKFTITNNTLYYNPSASISREIAAFDGTVLTISLPLTSSYTGTFEFTYVGEKTLNETSYNFLDYIVSDSSTDYPDGGVQDGYYYEKVKEAYKGIDCGVITLTSASQEITVEHNLGVAPTKCGLIDANTWATNGYSTWVASSGGYVYRGNVNVTDRCTKTNTTVTFLSANSDCPFKKGDTFLWVVAV